MITTRALLIWVAIIFCLVRLHLLLGRWKERRWRIWSYFGILRWLVRTIHEVRGECQGNQLPRQLFLRTYQHDYPQNGQFIERFGLRDCGEGLCMALWSYDCDHGMVHLPFAQDSCQGCRRNRFVQFDGRHYRLSTSCLDWRQPLSLNVSSRISISFFGIHRYCNSLST